MIQTVIFLTNLSFVTKVRVYLKRKNTLQYNLEVMCTQVSEEDPV